MTLNEEKSFVCSACSGLDFKVYRKWSDTLNIYVDYAQCNFCGMIIAPSSKDFDLSLIYTEDYFDKVDFGWKGRAKIVALYVSYINIFSNIKKKKTCDFGAGNGYLTKTLLNKGFNILAYEPFLKNDGFLEREYYHDTPFVADTLLMVEVFEHFTCAFEELNNALGDFHHPNIVIFTTNLTDNSTKPIEEWFYLSPDSGHFTIWSKKSLKLFGAGHGYSFISFDNSFLHVFCKESDKKVYIMLKFASFPVKLAAKAKGIIKRFLK